MGRKVNWSGDVACQGAVGIVWGRTSFPPSTRTSHARMPPGDVLIHTGDFSMGGELGEDLLERAALETSLNKTLGAAFP
eukprot:2625196-Amphidinium_carterae.1